MSSNYYDQAELWNSAASAAQLDVAQALKSIIPADVRTILDAGCGSGIVTNTLVDQWDVMGCDISQTALAQVNAPTVLADLTDLPFEDNQFDLVLSSDVIEHIPDDVYRSAIDEIARVAGKYILIAVPYREILEASFVQCPKCRSRFHAHYHQRPYTAASFEGLFPANFEVIATTLAGERWPFNNAALSQVGLQLADLDYEFPSAICPSCGTQREGRTSSPQAAIFERQLAALQYLRCENGLEPVPPPSELLVLLKRAPDFSAEKKRISEPESIHVGGSQSAVVLEQCPRLQHLINYPSVPYIIPDGELFDVLILPTLPRQLFTQQGSNSEPPQLVVYDAVKERYLNLSVEALESGEWRFTCPAASPSIGGYRIRIPKSAGLTELRGVGAEPLNWAECFDRAFEVNTAEQALRKEFDAKIEEHAKQLDAINTLANEIEARRVALEVELSKRQPVE